MSKTVIVVVGTNPETGECIAFLQGDASMASRAFDKDQAISKVAQESGAIKVIDLDETMPRMR